MDDNKQVTIPSYEELKDMPTQIDLELERMVGDDSEPSN